MTRDELRKLSQAAALPFKACDPDDPNCDKIALDRNGYGMLNSISHHAYIIAACNAVPGLLHELSASPWVSVKDRLPEGKHFDVLAVDNLRMVVCEYRGNGWFVTRPGEWNMHPTHWMPIPPMPPVPTVNWRDAIGASKSEPGEMSSEDAVRKGRE